MSGTLRLCVREVGLAVIYFWRLARERRTQARRSSAEARRRKSSGTSASYWLLLADIVERLQRPVEHTDYAGVLQCCRQCAQPKFPCVLHGLGPRQHPRQPHDKPRESPGHFIKNRWKCEPASKTENVEIAEIATVGGHLFRYTASAVHRLLQT